MKIIGVAGRKGAGKDTFAQPLIAAGFVQIRFADPLKKMLATMFECAGYWPGDIHRMLEEDLKETPVEALLGKTPRFAMQTLGTEWRDMFGKTLWTNIAVSKIRSLFHSENVIITDVRFPHEIPVLRQLGAYIVRVNREAAKPNDLSDHPSERDVDTLPVDLDVLNNGSIETLHAMALRIADTTKQSYI